MIISQQEARRRAGPADLAVALVRNDGRAAFGADDADEILQTSESIDVRR